MPKILAKNTKKYIEQKIDNSRLLDIITVWMIYLNDVEKEERYDDDLNKKTQVYNLACWICIHTLVA